MAPSVDGFDFRGLTKGGDRPPIADFDFEGLTPADRRSVFAQGVDAVTLPLVPQLATGARAIAEHLDRPREIKGGFLDALAAVPDVLRGLWNHPAETLRGGVAGVIEGAGDVAAQFTSPLDAALTVTGLRGVRTAGGIVGEAARRGTQIASGALALRGTERALDAETPGEAAAGLFQAALGAAGARGASARNPREAPPTPVRGQLRAAPIAVAPDGTALLPGQTIPMRQTPDGSYVRAERGEYARREPRALLPERAASSREFIATPEGLVQERGQLVNATVDVSPSPTATSRRDRAHRDASFVRGERAEYPAREVRGLLPARADAANEWITSPEGLTARRGDLANEARAAFDFSEVSRAPTSSDAGYVQPQVLAHLAGGGAGAAAGVASADDDASPGERVLRGIVGGVTGAALPALMRPNLRVQGARLVPDTNARIPVHPDARASQETARSSSPTPVRPHADPLAGTETFVNRFPAEFRDGIRDVLERNAGFDAQRRGVLNHADITRLAEGLQVDVSARLKPGTALNAEGIRRFADGLATTQAKVADLTRKVTGGQATDADLVALEAAKAEAATLSASVMGARAEAGRALAEFKVLARVLESGDPGLLRQAAEGLRGTQAEFAAAFAQLPDDPLARYRWLQQQRKPSVGEKVRSYYYANILSGLKTHERNAIGNAANIASHLVLHPVAAGLDAVRTRVTGRPPEIVFGELPSQTAGAIVGLQRGFREAMFALRHGVTRSSLSGAMSAAEAGKLDVPRVEFAGGGRNPFNYPGRALDASDAFFRSIARDMELYGGAHAQARREGLRGAELADRIAELVTGTDAVAQRLHAQADAFARRSVFQESPGPFAQAVQQVVRRLPALTFVMPFVKTPANIVRQGLEFSPAGFLMKAAKQEGRAGAQAQARATAGTMALGGLAYLAATGTLTGAGPSDPTARAQLMESGWRPNSIRVGDQWVSYSLFQPLSVPAAIVANTFEAWRDRGAKAEEADNAVTEALTAVWQATAKSGRSLLDQSFLSGVSDLFELVQQSDRPVAERTLGRLAHSMTPFAAAQRNVADALDARVRAPEGLTEQVLAATPGLSARVPAKLDRFGQEVRRPGGALRRGADPFNVSPVSTDPVVGELGRLGVRMGMPSATTAGTALSRDERRSLQQFKGQAVYQVLARLIETPKYQQLSDGQKAVVVEALIDRTRTATARAARRRFGGGAR